MSPYEALRQLVNYLEADPQLYDGDDDGVLGRVMHNATQALEHRPVMLQPGNHSVFVLSDDNTYEQPVFHIAKPMTEHEFKIAAEMECGGFISYGVQEDTDCPADCVRTFTKREAK